MTVFTYDFENGTDGVKVDPTDTPSAGDTAFSSVTENTGSGGVCKYSTTQAAHGTKSLKIQTVASSVSTYVQWDTTSFATTQYYRAYVYLAANPAANLDFIQIRDSATRARLRITTAGKVAVVNGSTAVGTSTASIGLNQWVRIEMKWVADASAGILEAKLFNTPDSTTADETVTVTALNTGAAGSTNLRIGLPIAAANFGPMYLDDLGVSDVAYMGPATVATNYNETVNDNTGLVDTRALIFSDVTDDSTGLTDVMTSVGGSKVATINDSAGLTDTRALAQARSVSDSTAITDVAVGNKLGSYGAAALKFNFEAGTSGVKVETTDVPSGGDTAFTGATENTTSGGTLKYDDSRAAHGAKSLKVATGATSTSSFVEWDTSGGGLQKWYRAYIYMDAPPAANRDIIQMRDSSTRFRIRVNSTGTISLVLGSTVVATSVDDGLPYGEWGRIEWRELVDSSAGELELKLFGADLDGETAAEVVLADSLNTGTTETTNIRIGIPVAAANFGPTWFDDLAVGYEDYLGPATGTVTQSGAFDDSTGLTDTLLAVSGNVLNESAGLSDSISWVGTFSRTISESAGVTDVVDNPNGKTANPTDGTGVTDSLSLSWVRRPTIQDTEFLTDQVSSQDRATVGGGSGQEFYDVPFAFYDTVPGSVTVYNGTGSLATALNGLSAGGWLMLNYDGDRVENINMALKNNITVFAAEGRRPWINGNIRFSAGEGVRIYGLNVRNDNIAGSDHMVKLDGGSIDWGYSIITLENNASGDGAYTLMRPGQALHDWRIHHCWIHDNPGATGHDGNQDHGLYCSAENANQNGLIDHCLIENMPEGRNIKIGGPSGGGGAIGKITIRHCTLRNGQGPSNGQVSNGATNTTWENLLLINSGASTNLTNGSGPGPGNVYRNCKGDKVVGPSVSTFSDGGGNTNNVALATLQNFSAQGALGFGHLQGFTAGGTGGTDYAENPVEPIRISDVLSVVKTGPAPQIFSDAQSFLDLRDDVSFDLIDTVNEQSVNDSIDTTDDISVDVGIIAFEFTPPTVSRRYLLDIPHPLFSRLSVDVSLSILKVGLSYRQVEDPNPIDITEADEFYLGGHTYTIDQATRDSLVAAGYGAYITRVQ